MKKILIVLTLVCILTGCDGDTKNLSCTSTTDVNGLTSKTSYDVEYVGDDIKYITITYDYSQGNNDDMDGVNADTDGITERKNNAGNNTGNTNGNNNDNTTGTTDTTTGNTGNTSGNNRVDADDIVDGIVGDAIDETIEGITETILDIAGIRNRYENQLTTYDNIEGFTYDVDVDNNNEYRIIYKIDMEKINDNDLSRFNVTRDLSDLRTSYESQGYTCK